MNNNTGILVQWLAVRYQPSLSWDKPSTQRYFVATPQASLFRRLSIPEDYSVVPYGLMPRNGFYILTTRHMPGAVSPDESRRLPYRVAMPPFEADIISVVTRLYPMGIQVARVSARINLDVEQINDDVLISLQRLRKPHSVQPADHVIRQVFALTTGDRTIDTASLRYRTYFGMQLPLPIAKDQLPSYVEEHRAAIIALLIGNRQPDALSKEIIGHIENDNKRLQEKSSFEHLLLNRQGLVYFVPKDDYDSPHPARFSRSLDISEVAWVANTFLEYSGGELSDNEDLVYFLLSKIEPWITSPRVVFAHSKTNELLWEVLAKSFSMAETLQLWNKTNDGTHATALTQKFNRVPRNWWAINDFPSYLKSLT